MDRSQSRNRVKIAIFGKGKVGTAMALEMPDVSHVGRGEDVECTLACVCWPAHALSNFAKQHPLASKAVKLAWSNGVWVQEEGMDLAGICYVRVTDKGEMADEGRKCWRVGNEAAAEVLRDAGLGVILSRNDHVGYVWAKALYLLPLALACADTGVSAKKVIDTDEYGFWYNTVRKRAVDIIGEERISNHESRIEYLVERSPKDWTPSPSVDELKYFRDKLGNG